MDADNGGKAPPPLTHPHLHHLHHLHRHHYNHYHPGCHHHFYYISPNCPLHNSILQPSKHSASCSFSTSYSSLQNPEPLTSTETNDGALIACDESEELELEGEDEKPIFVLTDEWRDFFAKSEAKRKQVEAKKQQAKKGKK